jgi:Bacterial phospholipase C, C-terminal domain
VRRAVPDCTTAVASRSYGYSWTTFPERLQQAGASAASGMTAQMFTVEAGRQHYATAPAASSGGYDVEVHGPNGTYRHLAGTIAAT